MLALRSEGRSFSAIARQLGIKRANEAYRAFHRALNQRPAGERRPLALGEQERLVSLEARIRLRDAAQPEKMAGRLEALKQMRDDLQPYLDANGDEGGEPAR